MRYTKAMVLAVFCACSLHAQKESRLLLEKTLPLQAEIEAAQAALADCSARHIGAHVFLFDRYGNVKLFLVSDTGRTDTTEGARRKGYTAVVTGQPTINFQKLLAENPNADVPKDPKMLFLGGAVPIFSGSELIGALSLGGGAPEQDAVCAQVGVDSIRRYL